MGGKIETEVEPANDSVVNNINVNVDPLALSPELMQFVLLQLFTGVQQVVNQYIRDVVIEVLDEQADERASAFVEFADKIQQITVQVIQDASKPGGILYRPDVSAFS